MAVGMRHAAVGMHRSHIDLRNLQEQRGSAFSSQQVLDLLIYYSTYACFAPLLQYLSDIEPST